MIFAIALRRSTVSMCHNTRFTGICGTMPDNIARRSNKKSHPSLVVTHYLLKQSARTDLSMLCQQTVLYFGTRLAVFLFLSVSISAAGDRLYA